MAAATMMPPRRLSLPQGFAVSGALHGLTALSLVLAMQLLATPPRPEPQMLALDLQGLMPEAVESTAQPPAEDTPPPPPQVQPVSQPVQKLRVPKVTKAPPAPAPAATVADTPAPAPPNSAQSPQTALTLSEAEIAYTKEVKRRLRAAMNASDEVRKAGLDGIVTIGFAIDQNGQLVADSLRLVRSSGIPVLDRNALSIPLTTSFDPPPRAMSLSVDLIFRS